MDKDTITVTTKGTFTLPAKIRKSMGVNKQGDKLLYSYDEKNKKLVIEKPTSDFKALQKTMQKLIDPSILPLANVDEFYQNNRSVK